MTPATFQLTALIRRRARAVDLDFHGADLAGADLTGLGADRLNLTGADVRGAKLADARLRDCRLDQALADDSDWSGATLRLCVLDRLHGAGARFDRARIEDSTAVGADLSRASLRGTHLTETSFARGVLIEAVLDDAEGDGVEFRGADLGRATLAGARFDQGDFRGADLRGADLTRGRFRGADFRGALLAGARFEGADCRGAAFDAGTPAPGTAPADTPPFEGVATALAAARDLIRSAAADPRLAALAAQLEAQDGGPTPVDPRLMLESLRKEMAAHGADVSEALRPFEQALAALESASGDEPPDEWRDWLEELMRNPPPQIAAIVAQLKKPPAGRTR
jgi:uncharacterized protein YjbI with pentapeptide repeats